MTRKGRRRLFGIGAAALLLGVIGTIVHFGFWRTAPRGAQDGLDAPVARATIPATDGPSRDHLPTGVTREQYDESARTVAGNSGKEPSAAAVFFHLGVNQMATNHFQTAAACFAAIPDDDPELGTVARLREGRALMEARNAPRAEAQLWKFLQLARKRSGVGDREVLEGFDLLRYLLGVQLRLERQREVLKAIYVTGKGDTVDTLLYCFPSLLRWDSSQAIAWAEDFFRHTPQDPRLRVAVGRFRISQGKLDEAESILKECCRDRPNDLAARAALLACHFERNDWPAMGRLLEELPPAKENDPWLLLINRGRYHNSRHECRKAIECFRMILLSDPANVEAYTGLAKSYELLGDEERRQAVLKRTSALARITNRLGSAVYRDSNLIPFLEIAELSESIGLRFHARAVAHVILQLQEKHVGAREFLAQLDAKGEADDPLLAVLPPDLDSLVDPLPPGGDRGPSRDESGSAAGAPPRFRDMALEAGIDFKRFDDMRGLNRILEQNGGGLAAFDYDRDGRVDIFFTNGCRLPRKERTGEQSNRLFRNMGGNRFTDVTVEAGLRWNGYCHGCAVGDYNGDGFDDLYVTAFGENRFWHNNGDGTFADITDRTSTAVPVWSSSAAFADLNRDGNLDLYVVNYVQTSDDPPELCRSEDDPNRYICCPPTIFPAEADVFFLSDGHGGFHDMTHQAGINGVDGKGLGIVVFDADQNGWPDVYISNDGMPNHLYMHQGVDEGSGPATPDGTVVAVPQFLEQAMIRGAAVDVNGQPNASMGIAFGDYDNDGWQDLLCAHFYGEMNVLYHNLGDGIFADESRASGLGPPSRMLLGFGTVFMDYDNNGWLDLFVTNGHVDDRTWNPKNTEPYRMPPSLYRNDQNGQFTDISSSAGPFFTGQYVGRSIATLDVDDDGDQDLVISHQAGPSALVVNETLTPFRSLTLALVGTGQSNRSAIGARIEVAGLGHRLVRELVGGASYQAACEQRIHVGLGQTTSAPLLQIQWPSGQVQQWQDVLAGSYIVVEGRADLVPAVR